MANFHRTAARSAERQGHERFFRALAPIFSNNGELYGKKKRKKLHQPEEVGLSSFLSSGYCTFLCVLKGCQINVFPTDSQAFAGNSCLHENNINHILPLYRSSPCKDLKCPL